MKVNEVVMYEKAPPGREKQVKHLKKVLLKVQLKHLDLFQD